jgi:hypothetical protein
MIAHEDLRERLLHAAIVPAIRAQAAKRWATLAPSLFTEDRSLRIPSISLRASDAGTCVRKLWHELRGSKEEVPADTQRYRFDSGLLEGLWNACLLAASLEEAGYETEIEPACAYFSPSGLFVTGHIDLLYWDPLPGGRIREVVEFKDNNSRVAVDAPDESTARDPFGRARYQVHQAATYAESKAAPTFAIVTTQGHLQVVRVDRYITDEWTSEITAEWTRLSAALGDEEPDEDVVVAYRCKGCSVLACVNNPNYREVAL